MGRKLPSPPRLADKDSKRVPTVARVGLFLSPEFWVTKSLVKKGFPSCRTTPMGFGSASCLALGLFNYGCQAHSRRRAHSIQLGLLATSGFVHLHHEAWQSYPLNPKDPKPKAGTKVLQTLHLPNLRYFVQAPLHD